MGRIFKILLALIIFLATFIGGFAAGQTALPPASQEEVDAAIDATVAALPPPPTYTAADPIYVEVEVVITNTPAPPTNTPQASPTSAQLMASPTTQVVVLIVTNTDGDGVYLRRTIEGGERIAAWPDDTKLVEIGESVAGEGQTWRKVRDPDGNEGFVPAKYLATGSEMEAAATIPDVSAHSVLNAEDASLGTTRRIIYRVGVEPGYTQAQLSQIARAIVDANHREGDLVNAVGFFFYLPDSNIAGRADASIDWAPNGNWDQADTVDTGDYSKHRFEVQFYRDRFQQNPQAGDSDLAERKRIFKELIAAEDQLTADTQRKYPRGDQWEERGDMYNDLRETYLMRVGSKYDLTLDDVFKIIGEGLRNDWPLD